MRAAAELADAALAEVLGQGLPGRTEREVAAALERAIRDRGAQRTSFPPIVAAGPHGARPHAQPRDVPIGPGELVVIDWGAELDGYCSDCTRTVATGALDDDAAAAYELVLEAQLAGLSAVRDGVHGRDADAAARAVIERAGQGEHFGHGLGHGVGLEIHEAPRVSQRSDATLRAGNAVTVEPGVYLPGRFGVRIEDLVIVTESGCEILTSLPKALTTVG
jgi:Xaa-Pro aminopeptidase